MPRVIISRLGLNEKLYKHLEELALQAHLTVKETIECVLHQEMIRSLKQKEAEDE